MLIPQVRHDYPQPMCGNCLSGHHGVADLSDPTLDLGSPTNDPVAAAQSTTLLIVQDKPLCAAGTANLLALMGVEGLPVVAPCFDRALEAAATPSLRLVLVDLPSVSFDFEGVRRLALATQAPIIVLDERPNAAFARLAQQAGARGYVCKTFDWSQARAVLRAVMEGGEHFSRGIPPGRQATVREPARLSLRQLEVLKCVALGLGNQDIGRALGITPGTVKLHVHAILRITGARNRVELALIADRFVAQTAGR